MDGLYPLAGHDINFMGVSPLGAPLVACLSISAGFPDLLK